jgi:hypothetical protein
MHDNHEKSNDPKARVAFQTEADPKDRRIEKGQTKELHAISNSVASIDATLKALLKVLTPPVQPKATRVAISTVSEPL